MISNDSKRDLLEELQYSAIEASDEDPDYPLSELHSTSTRGWQSQKTIPAPHTIILRIHNHQNVQLSRIQILAHESKIPQKIEIIVACDDGYTENDKGIITPPTSSSLLSPSRNNKNNSNNSLPSSSSIRTFDQCRIIRRLGYITFDTNERSQYKARELKSADVDIIERPCFVKLIVHQCHENEKNSDHQVGIISVELCGRRRQQRQGQEGQQQQQHDMVTTTLTNLTTPSSKTVIPTSPSQPHLPSSTPLSSSIDPTIQRRLTALQNLKLQKARDEDFENAAILKDAITHALSAIESYTSIESDMKRAAAAEDYLEASRLKKRRNAAKAMALRSLDDAELKSRRKMEVEGGGGEEEEEDGGVDCSVMSSSVVSASSARRRGRRGRRRREGERHASEMGEDMGVIGRDVEGSIISSKTTVNDDDDKTTISLKSQSKIKTDMPLSSSPPITMNNSNTTTTTHNHPPHKPSLMTLDDSSIDEQASSSSHSITSSPQHHNDNHPLSGIPHHLDLPTPEDTIDTTTTNKNNNNTSETCIEQISSLLGDYRTRCLFSKTWSLREAALIKTSLLLPEFFLSSSSQEKKSLSIIASILEHAIDDRIVPVYLAGLVLFDDVLTELSVAAAAAAAREDGDGSKKQQQHNPFMKCLIRLVEKRLSDSKPTVALASETLLLSVALSSSTAAADIAVMGGSLAVGQAVLKAKMTNAASRGGKAIGSRLRFLKRLIVECGGDGGVTMSQVMTFVREKANGFSHKDVDVRDAAKQLTTEVYKIIGDKVFDMLHGLSDRQLREYKVSFAAAMHQNKQSSHHPPTQPLSSRININDQYHNNHAPNEDHDSSSYSSSLRETTSSSGRHTTNTANTRPTHSSSSSSIMSSSYSQPGSSRSNTTTSRTATTPRYNDDDNWNDSHFE